MVLLFVWRREVDRMVDVEKWFLIEEPEIVVRGFDVVSHGPN